MSRTRHPLSHLEKSLNVWGIVLILWSIYRSVFGLGMGIWLDELVFKPLIFLLPISIFISVFEQTSFSKGVSLHMRTLPKDIVYGAAIGAVFVLTTYMMAGRIVERMSSEYFAFILIALASAFSEEALARGFILTRIFQHRANAVFASLFASLLFFIMRIPLLMTAGSLSGQSLIYAMVVNVVLSMIISLLFLQRRSLLFAVTINAMYMVSFYLFGAS